MKELKRRSDCPINFAVEILGDRWTLLIIRDLMFKGKHFYGEFLGSEENIATNMLADRLALLESQGIVQKSEIAQHRQKIKYQLTKKGIDLLPVLVDLIMWSAKYDKKSAVEPGFVKAVKKDREKLLKEISNRLLQE